MSQYGNFKSSIINVKKFEADKKFFLGKVSAAPDRRGKVKALLDGFELYGIAPKQADLSIANLNFFVHQAKYDPSSKLAI
jgi:hypothetical protein